MEQALIIPYSWQGLDYTPKWEDEETGKTIWGTRHYRLFIWGHDQHNDPTCWIVEDYMPHCYVKIEDIVENEEENAPLILDALNNNLKEYIREKSSTPNGTYLKGLLKVDRIIKGYLPERRRPMFYWNEKRDLVYKVFFDLEATMQLCYEYLDKRKIKMGNGLGISAKSYNNGVSDRIPTEEKLMVERSLERCSWMYGMARKVDHDGLTTLNKEYVISYQQMQMLPKEYSLKLGFPKPSTVSFDAETFSAVFTRFPKASRLDDEMYAWGFRHRVYRSLADTKPEITNYLFVIWDHSKYGPLKDYSKEYGKVVYVYCLNEPEFYRKIFEYLVRLDPTWLISFNGLGFDWDYLQQRCELHGIKVPNLSRIRGWFKSQFIPKTWKRYTATFPQYPGRIDVDMLWLIRIQFKFNSYKLKNVAKALLPGGTEKVELPYKEQFRIYAAKERDGMDKIMDYLLTDILLPEELFDKLSMPVYLHTNGSVMHVNPLSLYIDGQSIRCVAQLYHDVVAEGMYVDSRTIMKSGKYIGGLVFDQISGVYENVLTFDFNSLYPSKIRADNICYSSLINEKWEAEKPEEERIKDEECHIVEGEVPIIDKKTKEVISNEFHRFRYIKKTKHLGLLPKIVQRLNNLRSEYKKPMEAAYAKAKEIEKEIDDAKDEYAKAPTTDEQVLAERKGRLTELNKQKAFWKTEGDIWNVKQAAVKVSANSMYGFLGMKTGKFSFIEGGMSTTLGGRDALKKTLTIITGYFGAKLVYGDTDSVMVSFPSEFLNASNYKTKTKEVSAYISAQFPEELNIVFENFFDRFFTVTKKRYAGIKIHPKEPGRLATEEEIVRLRLLYIKGLISVRGNSCGIVYENFDPFMVKMLLKIPIQQLFDHIHAVVLGIMRRDYPLDDYTFVQKLGTNYKSMSNEMAIFSDRLKQLGRSHKPGEELEFVYVKTYGGCLKGFKMQTPDLFVENNNVLDTMYYVTNKLAKPLEQLLTCVYDDSVLKPYEKKIIRPRKPTSAQKVTNRWHLELYIRGYVAKIHANWAEAMNHLKCVAYIAEAKGYLNYVSDETVVARKMKEMYNVDWSPARDLTKIDAAEKKLPIHRHKVWMP